MWYFCHDQLHLGNCDEWSILWLLRHLVSLRRHADLRADSSMHHSSSEQLLRLLRLLRHSLDSLDSLDSKVPNRLGEIWDPCQGIWNVFFKIVMSWLELGWFWSAGFLALKSCTFHVLLPWSRKPKIQMCWFWFEKLILLFSKIQVMFLFEVFSNR